MLGTRNKGRRTLGLFLLLLFKESSGSSQNETAGNEHGLGEGGAELGVVEARAAVRSEETDSRACKIKAKQNKDSQVRENKRQKSVAETRKDDRGQWEDVREERRSSERFRNSSKRANTDPEDGEHAGMMKPDEKGE